MLLIAVIVLISRIPKRGTKIALYAVLIILAVIMIFPFYMMFAMSTHATSEIYSFPPDLLFGSRTLENFYKMTAAVNFPLSFLNSTIVSLSYTVLVLLFCSMGGYAFAVYDFPGRRQLFSLLLVTMMIPWTAGIIPWFMLMSKFGWVNSFKSLIIPGCANAFGIYWMRQYCSKNVSRSLMEAARIDGCSEWTIFFRIIAPVIQPAYASLGIMQFVNVWNDFMQPLLMLRDPDKMTLPLLLKTMVSDRGTDIGTLMFTSSCAVLPLLIVFLFASKYFLSGLTAGAVKE